MKNYKISAMAIRCVAFSCLCGSALALPGMAFAQSTPSELADLSLEDLLDFDVRGTSKTGQRKHWSFGYTYRRYSFGGYKKGTEDLSFDQVLFEPGETRTSQNYPVVPTFICQHVHAFSAAYELNDKFALHVLVPYIKQGTDHISSVPEFDNFLLKTDGIGDIAVMLSATKKLSDRRRISANMGIQVPTGSINTMGDTPRNGAGTLERLPYTMQLGSGTFDINGSVNYQAQLGAVQVGGNISGKLRTGRNDNDYRLGNSIGTSVWLQHTKNHWFQPGVKLIARHSGQITGMDDSLLVPSAFPYPASITDPSNYGGDKISATAMLKFCPDSSCNLNFTAEYGKPIYQKLNGIQPKERHNLSLGAAIRF